MQELELNRNSSQFDGGIPLWKRELLQRKRLQSLAAKDMNATNNYSTDNSKAIYQRPVSDNIPSKNMRSVNSDCYGGDVSGGAQRPLESEHRQLSQRSAAKQVESVASLRANEVEFATSSRPGFLHMSTDVHNSCNSVSVESGVVGDSGTFRPGKPVNSVLRGENSSTMQQKSATRTTGNVRKTTNRPPGDGQEEFEYGPGIVSKLKNKYLSLTMRENRTRPTLRKFNSLEDLLDENAPTEPEERTSRGRSSAQPSNKREAMKRARSVDSLTAARRLGDLTLPSKSKSVLENVTQELANGSKENGVSNDTFASIAVQESLPPIKSYQMKPLNVNNNPSPKINESFLKKYENSKANSVPIKPVLKAKPVILALQKPDYVKNVPKKMSSPNLNKSNYISPFSKSVKPLHNNAPISPVSAPSLTDNTSIEKSRVIIENEKNSIKSSKDISNTFSPKPLVLVENKHRPKLDLNTPPKLISPSSVSPPELTVPPHAPRYPTARISPDTSTPPKLPSRNARPVTPQHAPKLVPSPVLTSTPKTLSNNYMQPSCTSTPNSSAVNTSRDISSKDSTLKLTIEKDLSNHISNEIVERQSKPPSFKESHSPIPYMHKPSSSEKSIPNMFKESSTSISSSVTDVGKDERDKSDKKVVDRFASISLNDSKSNLNSLSVKSATEKKEQNIKTSPKIIPSAKLKPVEKVDSTKSNPNLTKVTTFSSNGDEFTEVIEAVNYVNKMERKASKDRWHQEASNSLVFNFTSSNTADTPDYIENDGVDISKKLSQVCSYFFIIFRCIIYRNEIRIPFNYDHIN